MSTKRRYNGGHTPAERERVREHLRSLHAEGRTETAARVAAALRVSRYFVARVRAELIAAGELPARKPWSYRGPGRGGANPRPEPAADTAPSPVEAASTAPAPEHPHPGRLAAVLAGDAAAQGADPGRGPGQHVAGGLTAMIGRTILSLCDYTGNWSRPYEEAGYQVIRVDLQHGQDVRLLRRIEEPVHGILAAPPCTHFSCAGNRWWKTKGTAAILEGMAVVDACLRCVAIYRPDWWALENPRGRLNHYLGPPKWRFQPYDFGDPYTKITGLWGHFTPPVPIVSRQCRVAVEPTHSAPGYVGGSGSGRRPSYINPRRGDFRGEKRKTERSATPPGFARAFFEANP
jgi:hypothetical protein